MRTTFQGFVHVRVIAAWSVAAGALWLVPHAGAGGPAVENDRLLWHIEFATPQAGGHTAVAEDGTIYSTDNIALYAVDPQGNLDWTLPGFGGGRPISIDAEGTIYSHAGAVVFAVNPDGTLRWTFAAADILVAGPSLGPDGNLYGSTDNSSTNPQQGKGAFSLEPGESSATLRWTDIGDPAIFSLPGQQSSRCLRRWSGRNGHHDNRAGRRRYLGV